MYVYTLFCLLVWLSGLGCGIVCRYCWFWVQQEVWVLQLCRLEKHVEPLSLLLLGSHLLLQFVRITAL